MKTLNFPKRDHVELLASIYAGNTAPKCNEVIFTILFSAVDAVVLAGDKAMVPTDLSIACPPGTYARIAPRSGLAAKHFIDVGAGVVDEDYRGNVTVILFNFGKTDFEIKKGDRIAQLVLEKISMAQVEETDDLDETVRGDGGFGSTGVSTSL